MNEHNVEVSIGFEVDSEPAGRLMDLADQFEQSAANASATLTEGLRESSQLMEQTRVAVEGWGLDPASAEAYAQLIEDQMTGVIDSGAMFGEAIRDGLNDPSIDGFFLKADRFFTEDPAFLSSLLSFDPASIGKGVLQQASGGLAEMASSSDLMGELGGMSGLPMGALAGAALSTGLGALTSKMFGKKEAVPVIVENAKEIADRIDNVASGVGGDPLSESFGLGREVDYGFVFEQAISEQREFFNVWFQEQVDSYYQLVNDPELTAAQRDALYAQIQRVHDTWGGLDAALESQFGEQVEAIESYYNKLGDSIGISGAQLAADVATVLQGLDASEKISSGALTDKDSDAYRQAMEQSRAAATAFDQLGKSFRDLSQDLEQLDSAWSAFNLSVEATLAGLTGSELELANQRVGRLQEELKGLAGEELIAGASGLQEALLQRHKLAEQSLSEMGRIREEAVVTLYEGFTGVIDGVYTEIEGKIPKAQRLFESFMRNFAEWGASISAIDGQLSELGDLRQSTQSRLDQMRFSIVNGLEELTTGESLPFLKKRYQDRSSAGADFGERQSLLEGLQESIFTAYNSTEISRPDALGRLDEIEGMFAALHDDREAALEAERQRMISMVDGSDWMRENGLSFEDYSSIQELERAVRIAHEEEISALRAEEAEHLWSEQERTRQSIENLTETTVLLLEGLVEDVAEKLGPQSESMRESLDALAVVMAGLKGRGENMVIQMVLDGKTLGEVVADLSESGMLRVDEDGRIVVN